MTILNIYTDGACSGNQNDQNLGGWGAILEFGVHEKELFGGEQNTTNNRMEMTALLRAFEALKQDGQHIRVFSDSSYLMDCFRKKWYISWLRNGWKTTSKAPVENRDLWEQLLPFLDRHQQVEFYRVKGHVNLKSKTVNFDALYEKFLEWNGSNFTFSDFQHITAMNNRADALANKGIDQLRESKDIEKI